MKIIGIAGYSGAGKSTVANMLHRQLPNCHLVRGDELFMKFAREDCYACASQPADKWLDFVAEVTNGLLNESIASLKNKNYDYIVIDSYLLPQFDIWNEIYYKLSVICNGKDASLRMALYNEKSKTEFHDRQRKIGPYINHAVFDYTFSNDDWDALEKEVKTIADKIKMGADIKRALPLPRRNDNARPIQEVR